MDKKINILAIIIASIALITSLIVTCLTFPNTENLGFDYQGIIVAVLGILIAFLVAWQIWSTIEVKNTIQQAKLTTDRLDEIDYKNTLTEKHIKFLLYNIAGFALCIQKRHAEAMLYAIKSLILQSEYEKLSIKYKNEDYCKQMFVKTDICNWASSLYECKCDFLIDKNEKNKTEYQRIFGKLDNFFTFENKEHTVDIASLILFMKRLERGEDVAEQEWEAIKEIADRNRS